MVLVVQKIFAVSHQRCDRGGRVWDKCRPGNGWFCWMPPSPHPTTSPITPPPLSPPWIAPPLRSKTSQFYANPNTTVIACPPSEQVCDMQTYPKNAQRKTLESTKRIQCMTLSCSLLFKSTRVIQCNESDGLLEFERPSIICKTG